VESREVRFLQHGIVPRPPQTDRSRRKPSPRSRSIRGCSPLVIASVFKLDIANQRTILRSVILKCNASDGDES